MSHDQECNPLLLAVVVVVIRCPPSSLHSTAIFTDQPEGFFPHLKLVLHVIVQLRSKECRKFLMDRSSSTISGEVGMGRSEYKTRPGCLTCARSHWWDMILYFVRRSSYVDGIGLHRQRRMEIDSKMTRCFKLVGLFLDFVCDADDLTEGLWEHLRVSYD